MVNAAFTDTDTDAGRAGSSAGSSDDPAPSEVALMARLDQIGADLAEVAADLDPNTVGLVYAEAVFDRFTKIEKIASGQCTRMAPRVTQATTGKPGVPDPDENMGRKMGTSTRKAKKRTKTGKKANTSPSLGNALQKGTLSPDQADTLAEAADHLPEEEIAELARQAPHWTRHQLAEEIARRRAGREDDTTRAKRLYGKRRFSMWQDADGAGNGRLIVPPAWLAEITAQLTPLKDRYFDLARKQGRCEDPGAYAADAIYELLTGKPAPDWDGSARPTGTDSKPEPNGKGTGGCKRCGSRRGSQDVRPERKLIVNVDIAALLRGSTMPGERCEIPGVGPVPVSEAKALLGNALLAIVLRDGIDIRNVTHLGRRPSAAQRTALEARGYQCEVPGCGATHRLEIDHVDDWSDTLQTILDLLAWLCRRHHRLKTRGKATLTGPPGARVWTEKDVKTGDPP